MEQWFKSKGMVFKILTKINVINNILKYKF